MSERKDVNASARCIQEGQWDKLGNLSHLGNDRGEYLESRHTNDFAAKARTDELEQATDPNKSTISGNPNVIHSMRVAAVSTSEQVINLNNHIGQHAASSVAAKTIQRSRNIAGVMITDDELSEISADELEEIERLLSSPESEEALQLVEVIGRRQPIKGDRRPLRDQQREAIGKLSKFLDRLGSKGAKLFACLGERKIGKSPVLVLALRNDQDSRHLLSKFPGTTAICSAMNVRQAMDRNDMEPIAALEQFIGSKELNSEELLSAFKEIYGHSIGRYLLVRCRNFDIGEQELLRPTNAQHNSFFASNPGVKAETESAVIDDIVSRIWEASNKFIDQALPPEIQYEGFSLLVSELTSLSDADRNRVFETYEERFGKSFAHHIARRNDQAGQDVIGMFTPGQEAVLQAMNLRQLLDRNENSDPVEALLELVRYHDMQECSSVLGAFKEVYNETALSYTARLCDKTERQDSRAREFRELIKKLALDSTEPLESTERQINILAEVNFNRADDREKEAMSQGNQTRMLAFAIHHAVSSSKPLEHTLSICRGDPRLDQELMQEYQALFGKEFKGAFEAHFEVEKKKLLGRIMEQERLARGHSFQAQATYGAAVEALNSGGLSGLFWANNRNNIDSALHGMKIENEEARRNIQAVFSMRGDLDKACGFFKEWQTLDQKARELIGAGKNREAQALYLSAYDKFEDGLKALSSGNAPTFSEEYIKGCAENHIMLGEAVARFDSWERKLQTTRKVAYIAGALASGPGGWGVAAAYTAALIGVAGVANVVEQSGHMAINRKSLANAAKDTGLNTLDDAKDILITRAAKVVGGPLAGGGRASTVLGRSATLVRSGVAGAAINSGIDVANQGFESWRTGQQFNLDTERLKHSAFVGSLGGGLGSIAAFMRGNGGLLRNVAANVTEYGGGYALGYATTQGDTADKMLAGFQSVVTTKVVHDSVARSQIPASRNTSQIANGSKVDSSGKSIPDEVAANVKSNQTSNSQGVTHSTPEASIGGQRLTFRAAWAQEWRQSFRVQRKGDASGNVRYIDYGKVPLSQEGARLKADSIQARGVFIREVFSAPFRMFTDTVKGRIGSATFSPFADSFKAWRSTLGAYRSHMFEQHYRGNLAELMQGVNRFQQKWVNTAERLARHRARLWTVEPITKMNSTPRAFLDSIRLDLHRMFRSWAMDRRMETAKRFKEFKQVYDDLGGTVDRRSLLSKRLWRVAEFITDFRRGRFWTVVDFNNLRTGHWRGVIDIPLADYIKFRFARTRLNIRLYSHDLEASYRARLGNPEKIPLSDAIRGLSSAWARLRYLRFSDPMRMVADWWTVSRAMVDRERSPRIIAKTWATLQGTTFSEKTSRYNRWLKTCATRWATFTVDLKMKRFFHAALHATGGVCGRLQIALDRFGCRIARNFNLVKAHINHWSTQLSLWAKSFRMEPVSALKSVGLFLAKAPIKLMEFSIRLALRPVEWLGAKFGFSQQMAQMREWCFKKYNTISKVVSSLIHDPRQAMRNAWGFFRYHVTIPLKQSVLRTVKAIADGIASPFKAVAEYIRQSRAYRLERIRTLTEKWLKEITGKEVHGVRANSPMYKRVERLISAKVDLLRGRFWRLIDYSAARDCITSLVHRDMRSAWNNFKKISIYSLPNHIRYSSLRCTNLIELAVPRIESWLKSTYNVRTRHLTEICQRYARAWAELSHFRLSGAFRNTLTILADGFRLWRAGIHLHQRRSFYKELQSVWTRIRTWSNPKRLGEIREAILSWVEFKSYLRHGCFFSALGALPGAIVSRLMYSSYYWSRQINRWQNQFLHLGDDFRTTITFPFRVGPRYISIQAQRFFVYRGIELTNAWKSLLNTPAFLIRHMARGTEALLAPVDEWRHYHCALGEAKAGMYGAKFIPPSPPEEAGGVKKRSGDDDDPPPPEEFEYARLPDPDDGPRNFEPALALDEPVTVTEAYAPRFDEAEILSRLGVESAPGHSDFGDYSGDWWKTNTRDHGPRGPGFAPRGSSSGFRGSRQQVSPSRSMSGDSISYVDSEGGTGISPQKLGRPQALAVLDMPEGFVDPTLNGVESDNLQVKPIADEPTIRAVSDNDISSLSRDELKAKANLARNEIEKLKSQAEGLKGQGKLEELVTVYESLEKAEKRFDRILQLMYPAKAQVSRAATIPQEKAGAFSAKTLRQDDDTALKIPDGPKAGERTEKVGRRQIPRGFLEKPATLIRTNTGTPIERGASARPAVKAQSHEKSDVIEDTVVAPRPIHEPVAPEPIEEVPFRPVPKEEVVVSRPIEVNLVKDPLLLGVTVPLQAVARTPVREIAESLREDESPEGYYARVNRPELQPRPVIYPDPSPIIRPANEAANKTKTKKAIPPFFPPDDEEKKKKKLVEEERKQRRRSLLAQEEEAGILPRSSAAKLIEDDLKFDGKKVGKHWHWKNLYS